jgi:hypothetical protein
MMLCVWDVGTSKTDMWKPKKYNDYFQKNDKLCNFKHGGHGSFITHFTSKSLEILLLLNLCCFQNLMMIRYLPEEPF